MQRAELRGAFALFDIADRHPIHPDHNSRSLLRKTARFPDPLELGAKLLLKGMKTLSLHTKHDIRFTVTTPQTGSLQFRVKSLYNANYLFAFVREREGGRSVVSTLCILAVSHRRERSFAQGAGNLLPGLIFRCIFPRAERFRKRQGTWHIAESPLFPGYVFAETPDPKALKAALQKGAEPVASFVGTLTPEERRFLESLMESSGLVRLSRGLIQDEQLNVYAGPLSGQEENVLKIDRHRRTALVAPDGESDRSKGVLVGLEVVSKT